MASQILPTSLIDALTLVNHQLLSFTTDSEFNNKLTLVFGNAINPEFYQQLWHSPDFNLASVIEIRTKNELNGANGAFSRDTGKIYLAEEYLQQFSIPLNPNPSASRHLPFQEENGQLSQIVFPTSQGGLGGLILEEYGHLIDAEVNPVESIGDEGAIFAQLVQGKNITAQELSTLQNEDDTANIILDGKTINIEQNTVTINVSGKSNPWLAGMPNGSTAISGDSAPNQSPVIISGLSLIPNSLLTFNVTGSVNNDPYASGLTPDGGVFFSHSQENGIGQITAPINSLIGIFLNSDQPNLTPANNNSLNFSSSGNVTNGINYTTLSPELKQVFFIGDGLNNQGITQTIVVPNGATRLFLGTMDGYGWNNNFGSFNVAVSDSLNLTYNGSAQQTIGVDGTTQVLRLTTNSGYQTGTAFLSNPITLDNNASFSTYFQFQISNPSGLGDADGAGADGLSFIVQTLANNVGGTGGGLGYQGITNSLAIEFDTFMNTWDQNNGNHIGIDLNGNITSVALQPISTRLNNGNIWHNWVDYNGVTDSLEVRISETNQRPQTPTLSYTVDLVPILGSTNAYVGFGAATGGGVEIHDILDWEFNANYAPISSGMLSFSSNTYSVNENATPINAITITRTGGSSGAVSVQLTPSNGTAIAPSDYNNAPITVNFASGEVSTTVTIPIVNDTNPEPDETINLILTNPTGGATIGTQNTATLNIIDNDSNLLITALPQGTSGSNQGKRTIAITGQNFSPNDQISLIAPNGTAINATKTYWVNETEAWANFNLQGLTTGLYDVKVQNGTNNAIKNDIFTVTNGAVGNVQFSLSYPSLGVVTLNYTNVGQTDLIAPLFRITSTNAQINYGDDNINSPTLRQLLNLVVGSGNNNITGILAPGESGSISLSYTPNGNGLISFAVEQVNPNDVINWGSIKTETRNEYSFVDNAGWDALWSNLTASLGTTVGQFQTVMSENANYLSQLGQKTSNLSRLFAFEWKQAVNTLTNVDLLSTTDVVDYAPGLSLTFNRTFYQSVAERYNLGTLGRGWASEWDLRATTDTQGDVIIRSVGDLQRVFEKQDDNVTYLEDGGASLTIVSGQYRLKEVSGIVSLFGSDGKLNYVEDTNGNRITLQYTSNRLTKLLHTNGDSLTLAYNAQGRISTITDSTAQITTYSYDTSGEHLLSVTSPDGTITYTYDTGTVAGKKHSLLSVTSDLGYQRTFEYDNQGRLTKEYSNGQAETLSYSYDSVGGVTVTDNTGATQTVLLDDRGNSGQIRGVNNQNLIFSYTAEGNLTGATLPNGSQPNYTYDSNGNLTQQTNLLGQNTNFTYDATFNQLTGFTDAKGNGVDYSYDSKGNLTKITYEDGSTQQFTVDSKGNITSYINRRGSTIGYTYNASGLLTKKQYTDGSSINYSYDTKGNLTSVVDSTGTMSMQYDSANRMTKITYPTGRSLTYTYNNDGQRTKLVSSDGYTVNYSYDTVGRLKTLTNGTNQNIITYDYDSAGRLIKETNGNSTYTTYQYDLQSQLTTLTNFKANNTVNSKYEYTYDNLGRCTTMTTLEGTFQYGYDALGQLTSVITPTNRTITYSYDGAGNRLGVTDNGVGTNYTTNNLNQYTNVGNSVYTYDTDGNLISKTTGSDTSNYTYDAESRLIQVVNAQGTWEYKYDGLGNRIATILNGQRTDYLVDPAGLGDVVGEYNTSGLVANYTHGIGLVSRVNGSNSNYYDADAIGSTVGLTATDGSYVNKYSYLPFGEDLTKVEGVANSFEYVGQWGVMDEGNGLDFMRARFYDSSLGRFNSADPIGLNGRDTNLYRYGLNNPVVAIDPSGKIVPAIIIGASLGAVTAGAIYYNNVNSGRESFSWQGLGANLLGGAIGGALGGGIIAAFTPSFALIPPLAKIGVEAIATVGGGVLLNR